MVDKEQASIIYLLMKNIIQIKITKFINKFKIKLQGVLSIQKNPYKLAKQENSISLPITVITSKQNRIFLTNPKTNLFLKDPKQKLSNLNLINNNGK